MVRNGNGGNSNSWLLEVWAGGVWEVNVVEGVGGSGWVKVGKCMGMRHVNELCW